MFYLHLTELLTIAIFYFFIPSSFAMDSKQRFYFAYSFDFISTILFFPGVCTFLSLYFPWNGVMTQNFLFMKSINVKRFAEMSRQDTFKNWTEYSYRNNCTSI